MESRNPPLDRDETSEPAAPPSAATNNRVRLWPLWIILTVAAGCYVTIAVWPDMQSGVPLALTYGTTILAALAIIVWLLAFSRIAARLKWTIAGAFLIVVTLAVSLVKVRGFTGDLGLILAFRWSNTTVPVKPQTGPAKLAAATGYDVPGFLGPGRQPIYPGVLLDPDWIAHPPRLQWRQPIGEGFSSFAVAGDFAVTQQQEGKRELVVCYQWRTGKPLWKYADEVYFSSFLGGDGPRATPTIDQGRVYALGATGILNCLDSRDGHLIWHRDVRQENLARNLNWGFSCSPLVVDNLVVVSAGLRGDLDAQRKVPHYTLIAYDKRTGKPVWHAGTDDASYCSPTLATIAGVTQILIANAGSVTAHDPHDGHVLWEFPWPNESRPTVSQVVALDGDRVFMSKGYGIGCELWQIRRSPKGRWSADKIWRRPQRMQTKFTNVVVHEGYVYGLSDGFLECIALDDGRQCWSTRRHREGNYNQGQVLLVGDLLLVQSEEGDIALVEPTPKRFHEIARFSAIAGRSWNYPVVVGDYLLVRNDTEAACYQLTRRSPSGR